MAETRYDMVVFGASGFTGQFVVEEVARISEEEGGLTWAIAGRSMDKLQKVLEQAASRTGKDLEKIPILIADVSSEESLAEMCKQAKVILNCVGPYRFYGEQVVRAAIENGASHIDISGEPQYLEKMLLLYHGKARENGVYVIGACGFDSIPGDMGVVYTRQQFEGDLNSVEVYFTVNSDEGFVGNTGTLESALHGFAHSSELKPLRQSLFPNPLPKSKHRVKPRPSMFKSEYTGKWCLPFMGSDRSIINRTVRYDYDNRKLRPIQVGVYACMKSFFMTVCTILFGVLFGIMAKFSLGRSLMMKYPSLFTFGLFRKGGPTMKEIERTSFQMLFVGHGYSQKTEDPDFQHDSAPDQTIIAKVMGPEMGYVTTPICLVQCAVCILKEKDKLPKDGGVFTPGSAFEDTTLIKRLCDHGMQFQKVSSESSATKE